MGVEQAVKLLVQFCAYQRAKELGLLDDDAREVAATLVHKQVAGSFDEFLAQIDSIVEVVAA